MNDEKSPMHAVLSGRKTSRPPVWLMRQAGRYLPEYRALRAQASTFLEFCYTPDLAVEATLQPIRRFDMDAAILFCDILVVPDALGQRVSFETGEGPRLAPIANSNDFRQLRSSLDIDRLGPVFDSIATIRARLAPEKALLGFCGAPWTVASYMIAGRGTPDQAPARLFAYRSQDLFKSIIDRLVETSIDYLIRQFRAGVDAVQIFDSWAGVLPPEEFNRWCLKPLAAIVAGVRREVPDGKIIAFPRGAGTHLLEVAEIPGISAIGLDTSTDSGWAAANIQPRIPVQGHLDPIALLAGGSRLAESVEQILLAFQNGPHVFNLGHGILKETPIEHVERMLDIIRR